MDDATLSLVVLAGVIAVYVANRLPVAVVAVLTTLTLWLTGLITPLEATAGFGDPVVIFIATLFVVSEGIDSTGVTTWAGRSIIAAAGTGRSRLLVALCGLAAVLTALITLNGAVAALLPLVVMLALRIGEPPAQMLMPLVFAGSAGGMLMLTGSTVNVIVSDAAAEAGEGPFALFSFAIVGIPIVLGTIAICVLLGPRLLPTERAGELAPDLAQHAETLGEHYPLTDGLYRMRVRELSRAIGQPASELDLTPYPGVLITGAQSPQRRSSLVDPLEIGDVLVVHGPPEPVRAFAVDLHLAVTHQRPAEAAGLLTREVGVVEAVVPPRSSLIGETVFAGMERAHDLVILSVRRLGRDKGIEPLEVAEGDALLLHGTWDALDDLQRDRDVLIVDSPDVIRRQAVPWGRKATTAVVIVLAMVVLLATGLVPPAIAGLIAATAMVLSKVVGVQQAARAISWEIVVLIGALIPLSTAIQSSGAADRMAGVIIDLVGAGSPHLLLLALFALTTILGQVVSNTATVLIVTPIAVSAAVATGTSVLPVLMVIAVAGSAALLTPIATPANLMIMGPAGYRFGDYWRLGIVVLLWWLTCALVIVPLVWSF